MTGQSETRKTLFGVRTAMVAVAAFTLVSLATLAPASAADIEQPDISVSGSKITWPEIGKAEGYNIYLEDNYITTIEVNSYTPSTSGTYYVTSFDKDTSPISYSIKSNLEYVDVGDSEPQPEIQVEERSADEAAIVLPATNSAPSPAQTRSTSYGYSQIFRDDFEGNSVSSNFSVPGWTSSPRDGRNAADACSQSGGELRLSIKQVGNERHACYLISNVGTFGPGSGSTMKVEYRANVSRVQAHGAWFAGWMYAVGTHSGGTHNAQDGNPATGIEIDVFEYMPTNELAFNSAIHDGPAFRSEKWSYPEHFSGIDLTQDSYHTYSMEWNQSCVAVFIDGTRVYTETSNISSTKNHSIMLTMEAQTGTQWSYWEVGNFADNLKSAPAEGRIDWVKVSEKNSIDPNLCA